MHLIHTFREKYSPYVKWQHDIEAELRAGSQVVLTEKGKVEYALYGSAGPYLAIMHGAPGGYDQATALFPGMVNRGFRILSWSRPGYLRTPLSAGKSFAEQADILASLLDTLNINKVAVMGFSAGGPPAIHFAQRYSKRIWSLILECAVSKKYILNPENVREQLFARLMFNDPAIWLSSQVAHYAPEIIAKSTIMMESSLDADKVEELLDTIMHDPGKLKVVMGLIKSMSPISLRRRGIINDMKQLSRIKDLALNIIKTPTLVIHGTNDFDVPFSHAELSATSIPDAELFKVEDGFHILSLTDHADEIAEKRIQFLKAHA